MTCITNMFVVISLGVEDAYLLPEERFQAPIYKNPEPQAEAVNRAV